MPGEFGRGGFRAHRPPHEGRRDQHFEATNQKGVTVNRWLSTGFLAASASSNETGYLTHKVVRSLGILAFDNQARV